MDNTISEALKQAVIRLGGSKVVAGWIWPEKSVDVAAKLLCNCLDENRAEKLSPDQAMFILRKAKDAGYHDAMHFFCESIGYSHPLPIEPRDEKAELQKRFINAAEEMKNLMAKLGALQ
jgi:hypothetical protein